MTWQRAVGGLSSAASIGIGAYGAHGLKQREGITDIKLKQFETGNKYHFLHSIALTCLPAVIPPTQQLALR